MHQQLFDMLIITIKNLHLISNHNVEWINTIQSKKSSSLHRQTPDGNDRSWITSKDLVGQPPIFSFGKANVIESFTTAPSALWVLGTLRCRQHFVAAWIWLRFLWTTNRFRLEVEEKDIDMGSNQPINESHIANIRVSSGIFMELWELSRSGLYLNRICSTSSYHCILSP